MSAREQKHRQDMDGLCALVADFYWEQDRHRRFIRLDPLGEHEHTSAPLGWLNKTPRELGFEPQTENTSTGDTHHPCPNMFRDRIVSYACENAAPRYYSLSGEAMVDPRGQRYGYRGIGKDVTAQILQTHELMEFRSVIEASQDMIFMVDRETMRFTYVNETACQLSGFGTDKNALLHTPPHALLMVDRTRLEREYDEVIRLGSLTAQAPSRTRDGQRTVVEKHQRALYRDGRWLIVSTVHDISARVRSERARDRLERMYAALNASNEAILRAATPDALYRQVCDAAVNGGGMALATVLVADTHADSMSFAASAGVPAQFTDGLAISLDSSAPEGASLVAECFRDCRPCISQDCLTDQRMRPWRGQARGAGIQSAAAVPLIGEGRCLGVMLLASNTKRSFDDDGIQLLQRMAENLVFALENFEHEAARKRGEAHIEYLATHDGLTGLANRSLFNQIVSMALETAKRRRRPLALLFIDLDRFKIINDSLGHAAGDTLLQIIAKRLTGCLRAFDVVARIGGDEFVVLLQDIDGGPAAARVARAMLSAVLAPVEIQGHEYRVTTSIGIALYPDDADDPAILMKHADMAMYQAKEEGKNNFQFYAPAMKERTLERVQLESYLRQAIEREEFKLVYQARISLATTRIIGVETLLRWHSAELGELTPNQFLPVAEETGLIISIGRWVLETACAQNMAWQRVGLPAIRIAINVSPVQFADAQLVTHLQDALAKTGMPPDLLELEITESAVMRDTGRALHVLEQIRALGVHIVIDNFGTGYCSLTQLKTLPVESLKIDRSFIRELCVDAADQSTARAIIAMAKSLSLNVVAEGVETAEQHSYLHAQACDDVQGFYFSRPDDPEALAALLQTHSLPAGDP